MGLCEVFVWQLNAGIDHKKYFMILFQLVNQTNCGVFKEIGNRILTNKYDETNATTLKMLKKTLCGHNKSLNAGMSPQL
ncbi:hypothetical protein AN396_10420 [Candidatus Epulonipiscium fishelsonii]|uniref:Uncharacterized protein n=1 Tax=Candidatus Epulonipiscium fishelsonii TaxID=77094 RepID=A0ACC8X907_9FIRM|nr:hypothetical protein AN396_10420 [Epulopiscium sp. SCG-B11WGA-EpuloA1]